MERAHHPTWANLKTFSTPKRPRKNYLTTQHLLYFKTLLHEIQEKLDQEIQHTLSTLQNEKTSLSDPLDRASCEELFSAELKTRSREGLYSQKVQRCLKDLEITLNNSEYYGYGYCQTCNSPIGIKRLKARPTATLCIHCKTYEEAIKDR